MLRTGLLLGLLVPIFQAIPICRPLKDDERYFLKTNRTVVIGNKKVIEDQLWQHRCVQVDNHGIEHIEAKCLEGTTKVDDGEPESTKGETYNYFQNSRGQRFEYEEIRVNLNEDPIEYVVAEIHSKLKDSTVVAGETWRDKSLNTTYQITVGEPKQFMKTECIEVIRKGEFTKGIAGEFREDSWYRTVDGQLMSQTTSADHVVIQDSPEISYFEKSEFRFEKN